MFAVVLASEATRAVLLVGLVWLGTVALMTWWAAWDWQRRWGWLALIVGSASLVGAWFGAIITNAG